MSARIQVNSCSVSIFQSAITNETIEVLDSVLDYPVYYPLISGFSNTTGNLSAIATTVQAAQASYKNGEFMTGSFVENQDQPRLQSMTKDQAVRFFFENWFCLFRAELHVTCFDSWLRML